MKQLTKLKIKDFVEMTDKEMKYIVGGSGSDSSGSGTCGHSTNSMGSGHCGISKEYAQQMVREYGGYWCCDSCSETSYCGSGSGNGSGGS